MMDEPVNGDGQAAEKRATWALCAQVFLDEGGTFELHLNEGIGDKVQFLLELQGLVTKGLAQFIGKERQARSQIAVPRVRAPRELRLKS